VKPCGRALAACTLAALLSTLAACSGSSGYSSQPTFRTDVQSIRVPVFGNATFSRGLEADLTAALIAELRKSTPWSVVATGDAQTSLTGSITRSELKKLSTARTSGLVEELAVVLTVDFEWKDNRSGKVLTSRRAFTSAQPFAPARDVGERLEIGERAAVQDLARSIVAEMRSNW
jgi:hypothetical protein